jgi:hypothetical protein
VSRAVRKRKKRPRKLSSTVKYLVGNASYVDASCLLNVQLQVALDLVILGDVVRDG